MKLLLLGSGIRTPLLIHGLLRRADALDLRELTLFDTDHERLAIMEWLACDIVRRNGGSFAVRRATSLEDAADGADFIFSAIRVGQEGSRVADERIALDAGVLGQETTGAGGFSMALRTIPVLLEYARTLERVAPQAWFVNFTNPAGLITQALRNETGLKVVGICDTPTAMRTSIARYLGRPLDDVFIDYVGLNHLGWIRDVAVDGRSRQRELLANYPALKAVGHEWSLFEPELVRALGLLPNEYLYYFYYRDRAVRHIRDSGSTRGMQIEAINRPLWQELGRAYRVQDADTALSIYAAAMLSRSGSYMARESGQAVPESAAADADARLAIYEDEGYAGLAMDVMQAIVQDRRATLVLNVRNDGCLSELEDTDVVEAVCLVDAQGIRPLAQPRLPDTILGLVESIKAYERKAVEAAVHGDREAGVLALALHPLVGSWPLARQLMDAYLEQHRELLPQFAG